jgi:hypothetical protein
MIVPVTNATPPITASSGSIPDQSLGGVDAVLQRDHRGPRPDYRADLFGDTFDVPQLDAGQNDIERADAGDIIRGLSRPDMCFAAVPLDTQPVLAYRREMGAASEEDHVRPGLGERGTIGSADAAGADHGDAHANLLIRAGSELPAGAR